MIYKNKKNIKSGFMMVEVLIVSAIIAGAFLIAIGVSQKSLQVGRQAVHTAQGAFLLEETAEAIRILRDNDWDNISALTSGVTYYPEFSGGTWTMSVLPNTVDIFTRTVVLSDVYRNAVSGDIDPLGTLDTGTRLVTVTITWTEGGQILTKTLAFYITDLFS